MVAVCLPFLVNLVILKVALPLLLVMALYVLPLTFNVTLTLLIALLFISFFKVIVYFLVLTDFLKDFALAITFGVPFLTITCNLTVDFLYKPFPTKLIVAVYVLGVKPFVEK